MDISKLSKGDRLVAGGAVVFFLAMFFPWFSIDVGPFSASANGWDFGFSGVITLLLLLVAAALVLLPAFGKPLNAPAITVLAIATVAVLIVVLKFLTGEHGLSRSIGLFLAILSAAASTFGGFLRFKEAGGSVADLKDPTKLKNEMQSGFQTLAKDLGDKVQPKDGSES